MLAIRPALGAGASVGIAMKLPRQSREIVAWIRGYDPGFPWTYRLRIPLVLPPNTTVSAAPSTPDCSVTLTVRTPDDERRGDDLAAPLKLHPHLVRRLAPETPDPNVTTPALVLIAFRVAVNRRRTIRC